MVFDAKISPIIPEDRHLIFLISILSITYIGPTQYTRKNNTPKIYPQNYSAHGNLVVSFSTCSLKSSNNSLASGDKFFCAQSPACINNIDL
jgi:hypothetical protein